MAIIIHQSALKVFHQCPSSHLRSEAVRAFPIVSDVPTLEGAFVSLGQLALLALVALAVEIAQVVGGDDTASVAIHHRTVLFPGVLANNATTTTTAGLLDALSETVGKLFAAAVAAANESSEADAADQLGYNGSSAFDNGGGGGGVAGRLVLNATGQVFENEFINGSGSTHAGTSIINGSYNESYSEMPQIPEYIRATSMVFCIIIMCLGVIGNIMVSRNDGLRHRNTVLANTFESLFVH